MLQRSSILACNRISCAPGDARMLEERRSHLTVEERRSHLSCAPGDALRPELQSHLLCSRSTGNAIAQGAGLSEASRTCCFSSTHLCSSSARMHSSSSNSSVAALLQIPRHADLAGLTHALVLRERMPLLAELQQSCNRATIELQQSCNS